MDTTAVQPFDHATFARHRPWEDAVLRFVGRSFQEEDMSAYLKRSYDVFLYHRLQRIIEEEPIVEVPLPGRRLFRVQFGQTFVDRPYIVDDNRSVRYITPNEARLRDLTYSSVVSVNVDTFLLQLDDKEGETVLEHKSHFKVHLARIPMMVQCAKCNLSGTTAQERVQLGECLFDDGGYFIVKGKERVLVSQERINYNIVHVFSSRNSPKTLCVGEIRSMSEETGHSVLVQMKLHIDYHMTVVIAYIAHDMPLGVVLRAMGVDVPQLEHMLRVHGLPVPEAATVVDFSESHADEEVVRHLFRDVGRFPTAEAAVQQIAQHVSASVQKERRGAYVEQVLLNELFPHMGVSSMMQTKIHFLLHMAKKVVDTNAGRRPLDDRDHIANKRVETAGILVADLFRTLFKRFARSVRAQLVRRQDVLLIMSRSTMITQGIRHAFSTGNWGVPKSSYMRTGVSQVLSRLSFMSTLSHLKRILIPIGKEGKNTKIRQVHPSQVGFVCAHETPEGHSAGIVKNLSLLTQVSVRNDPIYVYRTLESIPEVETDFVFVAGDRYVKIFVNGVWFANTRYEHRILTQLHAMRAARRLPATASLSFDPAFGEIHVFCDEGRLLRPLLDAKRLPSSAEWDAMSWTAAVEKNVLQWVDAHELETKTVAVFPWEVHADCDYVEVHPSLWMGACVNLIPFPEHTQSPRLCYVASMSKQAIGRFATTQAVRADTIAHVLHGPEQPIVKTHVGDTTGCDHLVSGNNLIVALCCYTGFNQEDSVLFNQSSIDRGVFRSTAFKTIVVEERKRTSYTVETIGAVPAHLRSKNWNYDKLGEHGYARIGEYVGMGDVLVGKVTVRTNKTGQESVDTSYVVKNGEDGYVDRIFESVSPDGYRMLKVRLRQVLIPEIGDKVCSRCAQKGTIGITLRHEDFPFSASGIVPDLIMNPHAIPSRMTLNQLLECLGAKSAALRGTLRYSTGFTSHSVDVIATLEQELADLGFQRHGNERLVSGITGKMLDAEIFIGPTYYHRLKHLVSSKIHARNHGNVQMLCRQPCEGRSRDGGLRFGEMERDAMISQGVSRFLVDRLFHMSDPFHVPLCQSCGTVPDSLQACPRCPGAVIYQVAVPYACKLLFQELQALGMDIRMALAQRALTISDGSSTDSDRKDMARYCP